VPQMPERLMAFLRKYAIWPGRIQSLEERLTSHQHNNELTILSLTEEIRRLEAELQRLRQETPYIAAYQHYTLSGQPPIFEDVTGARFICGNVSDFAGFSRSGSILDDLGLVRYAETAIRPGDKVIDVGAHIGGFSMLAGRLVGPQGRVIAFEAQTDNYRLLEQNIALNQMAGHITPEHCAVFSSSGEIELHVFDQASGWHTLGNPLFQGVDYQRVELVRSITLDEYCQAHAIETIDLLKTDVEGAEPDVLKGASTLLGRGAIKQLIFEVSQTPLKGMGYTVDDILAQIPGHIYHIRRIMQDGTTVLAARDEIAGTFFGNFVACQK